MDVLYYFKEQIVLSNDGEPKKQALAGKKDIRAKYNFDKQPYVLCPDLWS